MAPQAGGTYRTICVRTCDGGYFPLSFATVPASFPDEEKACKAQCPGAEANLYVYHNPGETMNQAVSLTGQPYTALPNAFRFRTEYNPSCSCKPAGETWAEALKGIDDKAQVAQQGDIIVTEESAKKMQQRLTKPVPASLKKGGAAPTAEAPSTPIPATNAAAQASGTSTTTSDKTKIRVVGPPFIPSH
jgi:hypothetical protein